MGESLYLSDHVSGTEELLPSLFALWQILQIIETQRTILMEYPKDVLAGRGMRLLLRTSPRWR